MHDCLQVMRNPVTDLTTMLGTTDIEDWVAFETVSVRDRVVLHVAL